MRIHIMSDLHMEFGPMKNYVPPECDVVILAGDIAHSAEGIEWSAETFDVPVFVLAGNHEFWGLSIDYSVLHATAAKYNHVHFFQNNMMVLDGVRFVGCTLWTDYNLWGNQPMSMIRAWGHTQDYSRIDWFTPDVALAEHAQSMGFLTATLNEPFDGETVVLTHHAPSEQSCFPQFRHDPANACYASNLDRFVEAMAPVLWVHGHTHQNVDYMIDRTRVVCNPRGYVGHNLNEGFNDQFVVEI